MQTLYNRPPWMPRTRTTVPIVTGYRCESMPSRRSSTPSSRSLLNCTSNSPRRARTPRLPPSPLHPTSSSRPSRHRLRARNGAESVGSSDIPSTNTAVPAQGHQWRVLRSLPWHLLRLWARPTAHPHHRTASGPAGRPRRGAPVDPGAWSSSGMVPVLPEAPGGSAPRGDRS